jgi:hypothetical protein
MSTDPEPTNTSGDTHDASPYIRTFAKDFAALSGKTPDQATTKIEREIRTPPPGPQKRIVMKKEKHVKKDVPSTVEPAPLAVDAVLGDGPVDFNQLQKDVDNLDDAALGIKKSSKSTNDLTTALDLSDTPSNEVPEKTVVQAEPSAAERESVLARLRARAKKTDAAPQISQTLPSVKTETVSVPTPIPPPALETSPEPRQYREPIPEVEIPFVPPSPRTPEPYTPPAPPQIRTSADGPSRLHTYSSDTAEEIKETNASPFSVLAAEHDARPLPPVAPVKKTSRGPLLVILGVLLLLVGGGGITAAYWFMSKSAIPTTISTQGILTPDSTTQLSGSGPSLMRAFAAETQKPLPPDAVELVYASTATTSADGTMLTPSMGGNFIAQLSLAAPSILLRNIDPSSVAGVVHAGSETRPFFLLKVVSYDRTFSGMLTWESTMRQDLVSLYPLNQINPSLAPSSDNQFSDEVVASHDTRVLRDSTGTTLLIYGYVDKQTLIIARNEAAFSLLVSRLHGN